MKLDLSKLCEFWIKKCPETGKLPNPLKKLDLSKLCEFCIKRCAEWRKMAAVN